MLLVVSQTKDLSSDKIIEWLYSFGYSSIVRMNEGDFISFPEIKNESDSISFNVKFSINKKKYCLSQIDSFVYRRGHIDKQFMLSKQIIEDPCSVELRRFLDLEWKTLTDFVFTKLQKISSYGNYFKTQINKLESLENAMRSGFNIPITLVSDNLQIINNFLLDQPCITKPLGEVMSIMDSNKFLDLSTAQLLSVKDSSENLLPSLIQNNIEKWIELRVFILHNEIYAMAMFTQSNDKTKLDYRNYDRNKMNRRVPFDLPQYIIVKVRKFMVISGLDTGSMDIIVTKRKEYVFLEINPAGNIEMLSESCNYYIERQISKHIIHASK